MDTQFPHQFTDLVSGLTHRNIPQDNGLTNIQGVVYSTERTGREPPDFTVPIRYLRLTWRPVVEKLFEVRNYPFFGIR